MIFLICHQFLIHVALLTSTLNLQFADNGFHPLHVSTTNVTFNAAEKDLEVTCTIFTDDLEEVIRKKYHQKTDLTRPDMHKAMDVLLNKYVSNHLQLKVNKSTGTLNYLGFEVDREAVNIYLESVKVATPREIAAVVTLLQDLYSDQLNIVHMTVGGNRKSARLDSPEKKVTQNF